MLNGYPPEYAGNMFLLSLSWDFSVGKKHNAEGKITNNVDRETGIAM